MLEVPYGIALGVSQEIVSTVFLEIPSGVYLVISPEALLRIPPGISIASSARIFEFLNEFRHQFLEFPKISPINAFLDFI